MLIHGSCHCRNLTFALDWRCDPSGIPARACTCSFCTRHGNVWTSCPTGSLRVTIADQTLASTYRFGTGTADFHVCTRCGTVTVASSRIDGHLYAVVSVNALDDVDPALLHKTSSDVADENEAARLARRKRNWIGDVVFVTA